MKTNVVIRADGGTSIGMGHVIRCLALAEMLKDDFNITFAIQQPSESIKNTIHSITPNIISLPETSDYAEDVLNLLTHVKPADIIVLDGYNFKTDYQQAIKNNDNKLVCIDDLHQWHQLADAVINHAEGAHVSDYSFEHYTKIRLGLKYVLLRKTFLQSSTKIRKIDGVKKVFISMGAADVNNITQKFTEALLQIEGIEEIHSMLGSINPNLASIEKLIDSNKQIKIKTHFNIAAEELKALLQECDIAICPASSISLEASAIGIGLISGYTAPNQMGILKGLVENNCLVNLHDMNAISIKGIKEELEKVISHPEILNEMIVNQKKLIDGKSPERLLNVFKNLEMQSKLKFRFAAAEDVDLYYNWANDEVVRNHSFNNNPIVHENHVAWFNSKLKSEVSKFYLFYIDNDIPVGQVRIDKSNEEVIIGISIDKDYRGKSLGVDMLKLACDSYFEQHPNAIIIAYIKEENISSYNIFKKAGFTNEEMVMEHGYKSYKLYKRKS